MSADDVTKTLTIDELLDTVSDEDMELSLIYGQMAENILEATLTTSHADYEDFDPEGIIYELFLQCAEYLQEECGFTMDDMIEDVISVSDLSPNRVLH